jgi:membrane fusion protein, multidrug efflux system
MKRSRLWVAATLAAAALFFAWKELEVPGVAHATTQPKAPSVPVTSATVQVQDVPVFLDGLGTVQAFNSVEIKAQVTGVLVDLPVREGQEVHKGDVIARIDASPFKASLDAAVAQRGEDEAELQSAQLDLKRFQTLAARSYAPIEQVDDQQATVSKETASISADEANIERAQINLAYCAIRAPFAGRVSLYKLDVGNLVQADSSTGIVSILQDQPIAVVLTLPEDQLLQVQDARAKGQVPIEAYDSQGQRLLARGTLLTPQNAIDATTGTISLKAEFANTDGRLWPGQFVNTRVQIDTLRKAVTIPSLSVEHGPDGLFVYLVKPDETVAQQAVSVGYEDNGLSVVTQGLSGGDVVVLTGQSRLAPGVRVKVTNAPKPAQLSANQPVPADPS